MGGGRQGPVGLLSLDLYNTLVVEDPLAALDDRVDRLLQCLETQRVEVTAEAVRASVAAARARYQKAWEIGEVYLPRTAASDVADELCTDCPQESRQAVEDVFLSAGGGPELRLIEGTAELLSAARKLGIGTCIVCDVGITTSAQIRSFLDSEGLTDLIGAFSFSDETFAYKPDPTAFLSAWRHYPGVTGHRIWHVGDMRRSDVVGAGRLGAFTIRFRHIHDDLDSARQEADVVIDDLRYLVEMISSA